ncbi:hypothetical protein B484DRAFT_431978 [Ochromonadaceae sp. CCMP2298]|nr:hypothetical protein B484DRAFT_431978 [Ochromonadaceae sp. CCMP2298]|mmetsp:Transcript_18394/g.40914  ORF Transcript_18394/g.40914 Transcript_18394/m.40914 type:complete len:118 (+) Transcript_18394:157-510(+)
MTLFGGSPDVEGLDEEVPEVSPYQRTTTDIKRQRLDVIKNAFCLAIFLALACYSFAASSNAHTRTWTTVAMYIFTCSGILVFMPRLCMAAFKFLDVAERPIYKRLITNREPEFNETI